MLTILEGEATVEKLEKELRNLVRDDDFRVRRMDLQEYLVSFPDQGSLNTFIKLREFQLSLYGLKVSLAKAARDYISSSSLQTVWVRITNISDFARDMDSVREIASLAVEPIAIDELSLIRDDAVRVKGKCRNPAAIMGGFEIFFNGDGVTVGFEVEAGKTRGRKV